jgi:chromosome segregation ATPase
MADRLEIKLAEIEGKLRALRDNDVDAARRIGALQSGLTTLAGHVAAALERFEQLEKRINKEEPKGSA